MRDSRWELIEVVKSSFIVAIGATFSSSSDILDSRTSRRVWND
jgi:hypothetical protein